MAWRSYQELVVWQKAMDTVTEIYQIVKKLPKDELYVLSDQMRRAAISIPSNIAEGQSRGSKKEFIRFLSIALGSKSELETQLLLSVKIGYLSDSDIEKAMSLLTETGKLLTAIRHSQYASLLKTINQKL
ncbi:MAG: four helix bundle protein [Treponema sp.]|nr:four helix bundle protein [Treponema sp.]